MDCPTCKADLPSGANFCPKCGASLSRVCGSCGHANQADSKFCSNCGTSMAADPAKGPAGPRPQAPPTAPLTPEHRQLSVMFCDLVDSVALAERIDAESLRDVLAAYQRRATEIVEAAGGMVAQYRGDGILAYFGYPVATEHDAERAIRAGLDLVKEAEGSAPAAERLQVRVGIATGMVVVGDLITSAVADRPPIVGGTPNLAARLQSVADADSVVIAPSTKRLAGGLYQYVDLGLQTLKGFSEPVRAWKVVGENVAESRFEALRSSNLPIIGRDEELGLLIRSWTRAKRGQGQAVLITGEAGIGKSRLTLALQDRLAADVHRRLIYHGSPYHKDSALYPVLNQLVRAAELEREDSDSRKLLKLVTVLAPTSKDLKEAVSLLAPLISIPLGPDYPPLELTPQRRKVRTFEALIGQLEVLASQQPLLMILEDVHWFDPTSLEIFTLTLERIANLPILMILTARPEFVSTWTGLPNVSSVALGRLGREEGEALASNIAKSKALPPEVVQRIVAQTDGVPLFVEELTKTVLESGLLDDEGDRYVLRGPLPSLAIPSTLHASLIARLDRLSAVKDVAQIAAAIGRGFSYSLLDAVAGLPEEELRTALAQLVGAELIFQRGSPPESSYLFKHALVQDAIYVSLVRSRRQQIHALIAKALEDQSGGSTEEPEILAHHFTAAGLGERAVHYWNQAGQQASDRSAFVEATKHFGAGIELLNTLSDMPARTRQSLALHVGLGAALIVTTGHSSPEVEQAYLKAHELCLQMDEAPELPAVLLGLWRCYIARSQLHKAREFATSLLELSERTGDSAQSVLAHYALGNCSLLLAELPEGRQHFELGIAHYLPEQRRFRDFRSAQDPGVSCRSYSALCLWLQGFPDQARTRAEDGVRLAHELGDPFSVAYAQCCLAFVSQFRCDVEEVRKQATAAVALATEHGFAAWAAMATSFLGWASAMAGDKEGGLVELQRGITGMRTMGAGIWLPFRCTMLAEVLDLLGKTEEGLRSLDEAQALIESTGERWWEAEVWRVRATLLLRHGMASQSEVEAALARALEVARQQKAKSLELRAATSLAGLWYQRGQQAQARGVIEPIRGWFTEGFDAFDLKKAAVLVEELRNKPL